MSSGAWIRRRLCLAILAAAVVSACSRGPDSTKTASDQAAPNEPEALRVGFQLDWYPAAEHGGHYQAVAKGYYRDQGLDVTILPGGPGAHGLVKVATGRADFAMGRCDDVILAVRQGLPLLIVCAQMQHDPQAVMLHEESPVRSFKDLDGRSVMCDIGEGWIKFLEVRYAMTFNKIPMDYGLAQFMGDRSFIQQCFITNEPYIAARQGVRTRSLLIADGGYDPYRVIYTSHAFAQSHPAAVRAFVAATIRGYRDFLYGDSSGARGTIQAENPTETPGVIDFSIAAMKKYRLVEGDPAKGEGIGLITPARMTAMLQTLVQLNLLDAAIPLERFVSFDFLPVGAAAQKG